MAHILREAEVQYGDFTGTAAADVADAGKVGLYDSVGLDRDAWWIVAFNIDALEPAELNDDVVRVHAIDKAKTGITSYEELQAYGRANGAVPVTEFLVHEITAVTIVRESFKRLAVQVRSRSLEGLALNVVNESDLNLTE